jgi:cephalosporin hydroxylase
MGVRWVSSTWPLIYSNPKKIISYDIVTNPNIIEVINLCNEYSVDYSFHERDVLQLEIEPTELLFIDTLHTYNQLISELKIHSNKVSKYIVLHDTDFFGRVDESVYEHASNLIKENPTTKQGLMTAVEDFLSTELGQSWEIFKIYKNNNGLTILKNKSYIKE